MDIGVGLPSTIPGVQGRVVAEWAKMAENYGFSTLGTIDRVVYPGYEPLVALAAAASVTQRIGLLTDILLAPTRNPVLLAKQAASIDQLSGGRLTLGIGVGSRNEDYEAARLSFAKRGKRLDADLELIHRVWEGAPVTGSRQGSSPQPVRGKVPLLIGGSTEKSIARAIRWGVGWTAGGGGPDMAGAFAERVRSAWANQRSDKPRIVALTYFAVGAEAAEGNRNYLMDYYEQMGPVAEQIVASVPNTNEALQLAVKSFAAAGVDELVFFPTVADLDQLQMLAKAVLT